MNKLTTTNHCNKVPNSKVIYARNSTEKKFRCHALGARLPYMGTALRITLRCYGSLPTIL
ncbi:hypothetical protein SFRURICE_004289 [Spodoptera frugiperda]|nr:hypothetical protein SFRURICE_004289 [Spodoptera frugiperda]